MGHRISAFRCFRRGLHVKAEKEIKVYSCNTDFILLPINLFLNSSLSTFMVLLYNESLLCPIIAEDEVGIWGGI